MQFHCNRGRRQTARRRKFWNIRPIGQCRNQRLQSYVWTLKAPLTFTLSVRRRFQFRTWYFAMKNPDFRRSGGRTRWKISRNSIWNQGITYGISAFYYCKWRKNRLKTVFIHIYIVVLLRTISIETASMLPNSTSFIDYWRILFAQYIV